MEFVNKAARTWLAPLVLLISSGVFLWLFLSPATKGDGITPRLFREFWNLGHFAIFFIWAWLLATVCSRWLKIKGIALLLLGLLLSFAAGYAIEDAQFTGGERSASVDDVILDVIGAFAALTIHPSCLAGLMRSLRVLLLLVAVGLTGYAIYPVTLLLADTFWQWRQFPVLLDFSTPLELSRIDGSAEFALQVREDRSEPSLHVTFETKRYSVFGFADFPEDWRGYRQLQIDVFNPEATPLKLHCRIQDKTHNQRHHDRYNTSVELAAGHGQIIIDLDDVRAAPRNREIDMASVDLSLCFSSRLARQRTLWVDRVALLK